MTIKAVFFDMDGTLLTDSRTVSRSTIASINALKQQGIIVGIATGRDPQFLLPYMASLGLDVAVAYNGQYIFSREQVIFQQALKPSTVAGMIDYAKNEHKELSLGTARGSVGSGIMHFGMGNTSYTFTRLIPKSWTGLVHFFFNRFVRFIRPRNMDNLYQWLDEPIYQMVLLATEAETRPLQEQFPDCQFTRSSRYATDIVTKGMSKLKGIAEVGLVYGFDVSQVMVFGDAANDIEMLKGTAYSVAMGNASKKAKKAAYYVTDTNNQDGILKAMQHFGLMGEWTDVSKSR